MSNQNPNEIWQVDVGGQIYEAPFGELGDWIGEGSLLPTDKVRKGNLRWIEAKRVPNLVPFFNAKEHGLPMPVVVQTTEAPIPPTPVEPPVETIAHTAGNFVMAVNDNENSLLDLGPDPVDHSLAAPTEPSVSSHDPNLCAIHSDVPTVFVCDGCGTGFCKVCPKAYGGSVRICPFCGALCRTTKEVEVKQAQFSQRATAVAGGFGPTDFFNALAHPFKFKASLIFGAVMFMAFTLGQSVSTLGGMYMMVSAIFCWMLANMLWFGVLANTIDKFTKGDLEANFMPDFEDFDLWNDVVQPFFLSIAAYISSFGPFLLVLVIGFYFVISSVTTQMDSFQQNVEKIPGTHYYDSKRTVEQSQDVKSVLQGVDKSQKDRLTELDESAYGVDGEESIEETEGGLIETEDGRKVDRETLEQEQLWAMAQEHRKQSFEGALGKSPETQAKESEAMLQGFLNLAAPLVVIGAICFLWGLFYFPAACAVAGYTRSFTATINPVVGLDTIKRLGTSYFKILMMGIALLLASMIVGGLAGVLFSPLDLPGFGNIPAKAIGALFGFYLSVVFSCILGYALFKKADQLQIKT